MNDDSYCELGSTYMPTDDYLKEEAYSLNYLTGSPYFKVQEIEVYEVKS